MHRSSLDIISIILTAHKGQYHWIAAIAPKRYNALLSFGTAWSTVFGCT